MRIYQTDQQLDTSMMNRYNPKEDRNSTGSMKDNNNSASSLASGSRRKFIQRANGKFVREMSWKRNHKSNVSFATGTSFADASEKGADGSSRRQVSRVAQMKAKFGGPEDLDASWGGALGEDISMSSSEDSDDDSLGDFNGHGMGDSANFRAKAQQSISFNMSFMNIGIEEPGSNSSMEGSGSNIGASGMGASSRRRAKTTGRGSIFVIADERFGQTKVVQTRLEKAAKKLQRFFRRCLLMLRTFNEEKDYLKSELVDIESRRKEELTDVEQFIKEEKEQFRMELEQELNGELWTPEEWDAYNKDTEDKKAAIAALKEENEQLKKDCKEMQHKNNQTAIVDPERQAEVRSLEIQIQKLELDQKEWTAIKGTFETAAQEAQRKLDLLTENRKSKRGHRKRMEDTIDRIIKLMQEHEATDNPKLVEKVQKLKAKREKKMKKLKAKTVLGQQGQIPMTVMEEGEEEEAEEKQQKKERRKGSRKQRQEADDDLPDLAGAQAADEAAAEKQKAKERGRSKNAPDDLPGMTSIDPATTQDAAEEDKAAKKKKKKDKKEKDKKGKKSKDKKKEKKASEDATFMSMYEAEANKKKRASSKKGESLSGDGQPGALMAIITG